MTDLDACFESGGNDGLDEFLMKNLDRVHHLHGVHAKVVLNHAAAFFGSANLTEQGLGQRDEMGCLIRDPSLVETLRQWFEDLFDFAKPVHSRHIEAAVKRGRKLAAARLSSGATAGRRGRAASGGRTSEWPDGPPDKRVSPAAEAIIEELMRFRIDPDNREVKKVLDVKLPAFAEELAAEGIEVRVVIKHPSKGSDRYRLDVTMPGGLEQRVCEERVRYPRYLSGKRFANILDQLEKHVRLHDDMPGLRRFFGRRPRRAARR